MENGHPIRTCKKCGEVKSLADFPVYDPRSGGRRHECRTCNETRVRQWQIDHLEERLRKTREQYAADPRRFWTPERRRKANEDNKRRSRAHREIVLKAYGEQCVCCGEGEKRFLTIDHVDNDGHIQRHIHGTGSQMYAWLIRNGFPGGFQVLCMNCNFGKALNGGICPHQAREGSTTIPQGSTAKRPEVPRPLTIRYLTASEQKAIKRAMLRSSRLVEGA